MKLKRFRVLSKVTQLEQEPSCLTPKPMMIFLLRGTVQVPAFLALHLNLVCTTDTIPDSPPSRGVCVGVYTRVCTHGAGLA